MRLLLVWALCVVFLGARGELSRKKRESKAAKNLLKIKADVNKVGQNMENLAFDLLGQLMGASDLDNGNSGEVQKTALQQSTTDTVTEMSETTLEENSSSPIDLTSKENIETERKPKLKLTRSRRSTSIQNPNVESNLVQQNSREIADDNFRIESPRHSGYGPEVQYFNARNSGREDNNIAKTCSKTEEEVSLENQRIKEINEEIKKLNELVILLRDQQKIMNLLGDGKTTSDITKRFGSADLLKILDKLNSNDERESRTIEHNIKSSVKTEKTLGEELQQIRNELKNTVATLNRTKIILAVEREKEAALEEELKKQRQELTSLKAKIENLLNFNVTADKKTDNEIVGAALPKMLPLVPPKHTNDTVLEKASARSSEDKSRMSARASELQRLIRMLEGEEDKKHKEDIMQERIKDLEKKVLESQAKNDDVNIDSSQFMRRLLLTRLLSGQVSNNEVNADSLLRRLTDGSLNGPAQSKVDELNELRALELAIQGLRPKEQLDVDGLSGKQDEAQFQAMLTKLIQQNSAASGAAGSSILSPNQALSVKNPMSILTNNELGGFGSYNGYGAQIPGLKLNPQPIGLYSNSYGYQNYDGIGGQYSSPYQPIPNNPYSVSNYVPNYSPFKQNYGPYPSQNYPEFPAYNNKPYPPIRSPNYGPTNIPVPPYVPPPKPYFPSVQNYAPNVQNYPANNQVDYAANSGGNHFFRVPQPSGNYDQPEPNPAYGGKGDGGPSYEQQGYNTQGSQLTEQYKYQKIDELKNQLYNLENAINNLKRPEYVQKPEDKVNIAHLEQKISDLKGVISSLSQQPLYGNEGPPAQNYPSNMMPPPPPPPQAAPPSYNPDQNQNAAQNNQNYDQKSRRRRSADDNKVNEEEAWNNIESFLKKFANTNESSNTNTYYQRSNSYDDVRQRIDDIKKQLEIHTQLPIGAQRTSYDPTTYNNQISYPSYPSYTNNYQNYLGDNKLQALKTKKQDVFESIILKILDKIIGVTPAALEKLFGYGISELSYSYGDSYSEVQNLFKNLGFFGYFPLIIVKIVESFSTFLNLLKKNPTVRNFLVPAAILILVSGAIIFLVWWLLPDYSKKQYYVGYDDNYSNNYNERNSYVRNNKRASNSNPNYVPYSRTYFENGRNWNLNNIVR